MKRQQAPFTDEVRRYLFENRQRCPRCLSLNCNLWRTLEALKFTEEERETYLDLYHPEDAQGRPR